MYFPPRYNIDTNMYNQFFKSIGNKFIVGGDFNAKHIWWGSRLSNPKGKRLYKCILDNNFKTLSTGKPTYWPTDPAKIPDLLDFFVYSGIPQTAFDIRACDDLSSDHTPVLLNYRANAIKVQTNKPLISSKTNIQYFQEWIDTHINLKICLKSGNDIDDAVEKFVRLIHEAAFQSSPVQVTANAPKLQASLEIRNLIKSKRRLRKVWQRTRLTQDKRNFNRAVQFLQKRLRDMKNEGIGRYLTQLSPSNNNEFNLFKSTKYLKRPQKRSVPIKKDDGSWCRTDSEIAMAYKEFLEETFTPFSLCNTDDYQKTSDFLEVPCQMCLPIKPFTFSEITTEIKKLNVKKSPGFDQIDGKTMKYLPRKGIVFLTTLFNSIMRLSYFPSQWKHAKIIMVRKPNKPENLLSSYRPISLLPVFSKVFERLFQKRMLPIIENLNIIPDHQFGFRHKHGTPEQCHRVVEVIRESLEKKLYCCSTFLDVKQAFDRVWHKGLLFKLKTLLPTPYYLLFKSYLHERSFYVSVNGDESDIGSIKSGVPQGSVMGPVLYTIYTADMPVRNDVTIATYADDTAILATSPSAEEASRTAQRQLDELQLWFNKWNIRVNPEKSTNVTYTLRNEKCPPLSLNGVTIPASNCVKYLGLRIDCRLTWKDHIKSKRKEIDIKTKKMYWLIGPKSQLSLENKVRLYKTVLKPVWSYGIELWGTASNSNIEILQRYQSKTLRLLSNAPWFVSNNCIHNDLDVANIKDEIARLSSSYLNRLSNHTNILAIALLDDSSEVRRLKRKHILDLPFIK